MSFSKGGKSLTYIIAPVVVLLIILGGFIAYKSYSDGAESKRQAEEKARVDAEREAKLREPIKIDNYGNSDKDMAELAKAEGPKYDYANEKLRGTDPAKWDRGMLDLAYSSLVYADKIDDFTNSYSLINKINFAQKAGLDIDDNEYGIDVKKREAMRERASDFLHG